MLGNENYEELFEIRTVRSIDEYLKQINDISDEVNNDVYYRGESKCFPTMTPTIYRHPNVANKSESYYAQLEMEASNELQNDTGLFDELTHLQHYGAKTRLLDVSSSPLVALFFAIDSGDQTDAFVFAFDGGENSINVKSGIGRSVMIKTVPNFIEQEKTHNFLNSFDLNRIGSPTNIMARIGGNEDIDGILFFKQYREVIAAMVKTLDEIKTEDYELGLRASEKYDNPTEYYTDDSEEKNKINEYIQEKYDHFFYYVRQKLIGSFEEINSLRLLSLLFELCAKEFENVNQVSSVEAYRSLCSQGNWAIKAADEFFDRVNSIERLQMKEYVPSINDYKVLTNAQIFNARKSTDRIIRQLGAFILPAYEKSPIDSESKSKKEIEESILRLMVHLNGQNEKPVVIRIPKENKLEMKKRSMQLALI